MAEALDIVFPDVEEVLTSLSKKYTLALLSNAKRDHYNLVFPEFLAGLFGETLFWDDMERPKPSPEPLLKMLARLGMRENQCCYVGDSVLDIQMSKSAGVTMFAVATGTHSIDELSAAGADEAFASLRQLGERLKSEVFKR